MSRIPVELDLPFGEPDTDRDVMATQRYQHLGALPGVDAETAVRLARAFGSLSELYSAPEEQLRTIVGAVPAARIRWFLDAPLRAVGAPAQRRADWRSFARAHAA